MRAFSHAASANVPTAASLTLAQWEALPLPARIAHRVADMVVLLDAIREQLHTEEGSPLLWMEEPLDRMSAEVDAVLRRLSM